MGGGAVAADGEALRAGVRRPVIVGVTVLTSLSGADIEGIFGRTMDVADVVIMLAGRAREAGLDGVVASVGETVRIKREIGGSCVVVTPGIRPANGAAGDQKRVATPREAAAAGSDYIVVGRPIIRAPSPVDAALNILDDLRNG